MSGSTSVDIGAVTPRGGSIVAEIMVADPDPEPGNNTWRAVLD